MHFPTVLVAALTSAFALLASATPIVTSTQANVVARSDDAPLMVIYTDDYINNETGLPTAANLAGYNVLILAFLMAKGPVDQVEQFKMLSTSDRAALKKSYNDAGITLMCSAFGSTDAPTTDGHDAASLASQHAAIVKELGLQGIDVDYEDMTAVNKADGKAEAWLITYTQTLRSNLPAGQYFITHAPVAPWFSKNAYPAGAYWKVYEEAGDDIDWFNVQFYNQGSSEYTTCANLIEESGGDFPGTSIFEIHTKAGVPLNKLVIGKPSSASQADNGFIPFDTLSECINTAAQKGWTAGVMLWEYETSMSTSYISAVTKALAAIGGNNIPVSPGTTTSKTTESTTSASVSTSTKAAETTTSTASVTTKPHESVTTTSSASPTTTSSISNVSGGSCTGVKAWSSTTTYSGGTVVSGTGDYVTYNGILWENKWWTQGDTPGSGGDADPWAQIKSCSSSKRMDDVETNVARAAGAANITRSRRSSHNNRQRRSHLARLNELS